MAAPLDADTLGLLARMPLFEGIAPAELAGLLPRLRARICSYSQGESILRSGSPVRELGLVVEGAVVIESVDAWGGTALLARIGAGRVFAEAYACVPDEPLMVDVLAAEATTVLFVDVGRATGPSAGDDPATRRVAANLLGTLARQSLALARRAANTAPKTMRGKVLSYLSDQSRRAGSDSFEIPLDRQQLANYLGVDRSALSAELSRMRADGLIAYRRSSFTLLRNPSL